MNERKDERMDGMQDGRMDGGLTLTSRWSDGKKARMGIDGRMD